MICVGIFSLEYDQSMDMDPDKIYFTNGDYKNCCAYTHLSLLKKKDDGLPLLMLTINPAFFPLHPQVD